MKNSKEVSFERIEKYEPQTNSWIRRRRLIYGLIAVGAPLAVLIVLQILFDLASHPFYATGILVLYMVFGADLFDDQKSFLVLGGRPANIHSLKAVERYSDLMPVRHMLDRIARCGRPISQYEANLIIEVSGRYQASVDSAQLQRDLLRTNGF